MIKVVYAIFPIAIKDLEVRFANSNLPLGKNVIKFELLAEKKRLVSRELVYYIANI